MIGIEDFGKVKLRVAEVVAAEPVPKADKLLKLQLSLGEGQPQRQVVSGIAQFYQLMNSSASMSCSSPTSSRPNSAASSRRA